MLVTIGGILAGLAGISVTLFYAVSDIRRRSVAIDEVRQSWRSRHALHYADAITCLQFRSDERVLLVEK